jgi:hypothetical protein
VRDAILIPCAGHGERWGRHLDRPKQLIEIEGEPVLVRLVRLARERQPRARICVIGSDERLAVADAELVEPDPEPRPCGIDKLTCGRSRWSSDDRTWLVYGDVYLSDAGADVMFGYEGAGPQWFGCSTPNELTGKGYPELYAVTFTPGEAERLERACAQVRYMYRGQMIPRASGWEAYRCQVGGDPRRHEMCGDFTEIADWTDDFDYARDYDEWTRRRGAQGLAVNQ